MLHRHMKNYVEFELDKATIDPKKNRHKFWLWFWLAIIIVSAIMMVFSFLDQLEIANYVGG